MTGQKYNILKKVLTVGKNTGDKRQLILRCLFRLNLGSSQVFVMLSMHQYASTMQVCMNDGTDVLAYI